MGCSWLFREHVHARHLYLSTCAPFVDLGLKLFEGLEKALQSEGLLCLSLGQLPSWFQAYVFHIPHSMSQNVFKGLSAYKIYTTFSNGSLGSRIDEERSEMR